MKKLSVSNNKFFVLGLVLIGLTLIIYLNPRRTVAWDAVDYWFPYFSWIGQCLRQGYWGDFFPKTFSGYPLGGDMQVGIVNPLFLLGSYLFPFTTYNVNFIYSVLSILHYVLGFLIAKKCGLRDAGAFCFGILALANGYFIGHSEHLSFLTTSLSFLLYTYGFACAYRDESFRKLFLLFFLGAFEGFSCGYPGVLLFHAITYIGTSIYFLITYPKLFKKLFLSISLASSLALIILLPHLYHAFREIGLSTREEGVSIDLTMSNSMPIYSFLRFFAPFWNWSDGTIDVSMDRVHLLILSPIFLYFGIRALPALFHAKHSRRRYCFLAFLFLSMTIWMLGDHFVIPFRRFAGEHFKLFRMSRFPCSEMHYQWLLFVAAITALGFQSFYEKSKSGLFKIEILNRRNVVLGFFSFDFLLTTLLLAHFRITDSPTKDLPNGIHFDVSYDASTQAAFDKPRKCKLSFEAEIAPKDFGLGISSWWGFSSLVSKKYQAERDSMRELICAQGRLFDLKSRVPVEYSLVSASPGRVEFTLNSNVSKTLFKEGLVTLIWTETTDGFWKVYVNGQERDLRLGPAQLRVFDVLPSDFSQSVEKSHGGYFDGSLVGSDGSDGSSGIRIEMRYLSPYRLIFAKIFNIF